MFKFNVGDVVQVVKSGFKNIDQFLGQEIVITRAVFFSNRNLYETKVYNFFEEEIELVQSAPQAPIFISTNSSQLHPANILKEYYDDSVAFYTGSITETIFNKKCECGSHAVGVDRHSDYCPLYSKN